MREKGHEALTAKDAGLRDADDHLIWSFAIASDAIIITKGEDFVRLATTAERPNILWVRAGNTVNRIAHFERAWTQIEAHFAAGARLVELR